MPKTRTMPAIAEGGGEKPQEAGGRGPQRPSQSTHPQSGKFYTNFLRELARANRNYQSLVLRGITLQCKKTSAIFPSLAGMSQTKLSQAGNDVIIPGQGEFG
jgi:hypothetical protein